MIDVSELPIFRRDEQDGAFKRFVYTLIDKFYNKVRVVNDDDSVTEVSESEDEEPSEETLSTSVEEESLELESDDESEFQEDSEDIESESGSSGEE